MMEECESYCGGRFLNKLNQINKKVTIESPLAELLESYLKKLHETDLYLKNDIVTTNFAEAALLLQGSVQCYAKKIDLLWNEVFDYQHHFSLVSKTFDNQNNTEQIEERRTKHAKKKTRKKPEEIVDDLDFDDEELDALCFDEVDESLFYNWQKMTKITPQKSSELDIFTKSSIDDVCPSIDTTYFIAPKTTLYDEDDEIITRYNQLASGRTIEKIECLLKTNYMEHDEFTLHLFKDFYALPSFFSNRESAISVAAFAKHREDVDDFLKAYNANLVDRGETQQTESVSELTPMENTGKIVKRSASMTPSHFCLDQEADDKFLSKSYVLLERLTFEHLPKGYELMNVMKQEHSPDIGILRDIPETCCSKIGNDSGFFEEINYDDSQEVAKVGFEEKARTPMPYLDSETEDDMEEFVTVIIEPEDATRENSECLSAEGDSLYAECAACDGQKIVGMFPPRKLLFPKKLAIKEKVVRKVSIEKEEERLDLKRLKVSHRTAELITFEQFFKQNYNTDSGEADAITESVEMEEVLEEIRIVPQENIEEELVELEVQQQIEAENEIAEENVIEFEEIEEVTESEPNATLVSSELPESGRFTPPLEDRNLNAGEFITSTPKCSSTVPEPETNLNEVHVEEVQNRSDLSTWRSFINEKLKSLKEKPEFNIYNYSSQIIDSLSANRSQLFSNIVKGKGSAEVARYFISTLHLANTGNVRITGNQPGKLSNQTFNLELIKKDQYHESLTKFLAPSELMYAKNIEQVRSFRSKLGEKSYEPPAKRHKFY